MRNVLSKSAFIAVSKPKTIEVEIELEDGSKGMVLVCELPQPVHEAIMDNPANQKGEEKDYFKIITDIITTSVVNADGSRMFDDSENDKAIVAGFSREMRGKLSDAAIKANNFGVEEKKPSEPTSDGSNIGELQLPLDIDTPTNSSEA